MYPISKKVLCVLLLLFVFISVGFTQKYRIESVQYEITGITKEYALKQAVPIDTERVFENSTELLLYISFIEKELNNQRVIETASLLPVYGEVNSDNIVPVILTVQTKDSINMIGVPYPNYNSNTGLTLKIKFKNYNFLGTMKTLTIDFNYKYDTSDEKNPKHNLGFNFNEDFPFSLGPFHANWANSFSTDITLGLTHPDLDFSTGLSISLPLDITSLNFSVTQKVILNSDYYDYDDYCYFTESASFSTPFTIAQIPNWGNVNWTPSVSLNYNWDYNGIKHSDLFGPSLSFGHSISTGHVDWIENFRKGFNFSVSQSASYNIQTKSFSPFISAEATYYAASKYVGFDSRAYWFRNINGTTDIGGRLRGIKDSQTAIGTPSAIVCNFAIPFRVFRSNWVGWGFWNWMQYVDLDIQLSPFIDFALFENTATGSAFNYKDGWYSGGLEMIGFPARMRSIQGRFSFGIDLARTIIPGRFINKSWRDYCSRWEFTFGLGLFF